MKRNLEKRILSFLLVFLIVLNFSVTTAFATNYASVAENEEVIVNIENYCNPGASTYSSKAASPTYHYKFASGSTAIFRMRFVTKDDSSVGSPRVDENGNILWVYCMEFEVDAKPFYWRKAESSTNSTHSVWTNLSEQQKRGILLTMLYGYPVSNNGASAADSYAATQAILWEFQTGVRNSTTSNTRNAVTYNYTNNSGVSKSMNLTSDFFYNIMSITSGGKTAYDTLISKIYAHDKMPNFGVSNGKIDMSYDSKTGKYTATLTDSNNALSTFDVTATSGISVSVSGNKITLTSSKPISGGKLSFSKKAQTVTSQGLMILKASPNGQAMIMGQEQVNSGTSYTVNALNGSLKIQKSSSDGVVSGLKFNVVGPGVDMVLTTDSSGAAYLNNVPAGVYTVTEQTPLRYVAQGSKTVTVNSGQTAIASFTNTLIQGNLKILKVDGETDLPIAGALFEVYDENDVLISQKMTDENGVALFENLEYGNYYVLEHIAPEGYVRNEEVFDFSILTNGIVIEKTYEEEPLLRNFSVYKKGEVLTGFEEKEIDGRTIYSPVYEEQYLSDCEIGVFAAEDIVTLDGTVRFEKDELVDTIVTTSEGPAKSKDLFEGKYYLKEITAPAGFVLNDETISVDLFEDDLEFTFTNERQKCELTFKKSMSNTTGDALSGYYKQVSFGLFSGEDILDLPKDSLLEVLCPNDEGDCVSLSDLPFGYSYYVKELGTATGFILDEKDYAFSFITLPQTETVFAATVNEGADIVNFMEPVTEERVFLDAHETKNEGAKTGDTLETPLVIAFIVAVSSLFGLIVIFKNNKLTLN